MLHFSSIVSPVNSIPVSRLYIRTYKPAKQVLQGNIDLQARITLTRTQPAMHVITQHLQNLLMGH
jgi:hypothetical protein